MQVLQLPMVPQEGPEQRTPLGGTGKCTASTHDADLGHHTPRTQGDCSGPGLPGGQALLCVHLRACVVSGQRRACIPKGSQGPQLH